MAYIKDGCYCNEDYYEEDHECYREKEKDKKDCCYYAKHPEPKKILLECGCHPHDAIFDVDECYKKHYEEFVLDKVLVDTTCLCRPLVKIEFSSVVFFEAEGKGLCEQEIELELIFELERACNGHKECVQTWKYAREFEVKSEKLEVEFSDPFAVTFCDRTCPGCCEYIMKVKVKKLEGKFEALRVTKPDLSALAQGICDD